MSLSQPWNESRDHFSEEPYLLSRDCAQPQDPGVRRAPCGWAPLCRSLPAGTGSPTLPCFCTGSRCNNHGFITDSSDSNTTSLISPTVRNLVPIIYNIFTSLFTYRTHKVVSELLTPTREKHIHDKTTASTSNRFCPQPDNTLSRYCPPASLR